MLLFLAAVISRTEYLPVQVSDTTMLIDIQKPGTKKQNNLTSNRKNKAVKIGQPKLFLEEKFYL